MWGFLQCLALALLTTTRMASSSDPWGENMTPRLRVNYLSQKSGKKKILKSLNSKLRSFFKNVHSA